MNSSSAIALSLDEAIETLLTNGEIAPADSTSSAAVSFIIQYNYTFKPLNVTVQVNFVYKTKIPCYKNLNFCSEWCPPYSNSTDYNCGSCDNLKAPIQSFMNYEASKSNFENDTINDDNNSQNDFESIGELKDIVKSGGDDKTYFSMDSSKW